MCLYPVECPDERHSGIHDYRGICLQDHERPPLCFLSLQGRATAPEPHMWADSFCRCTRVRLCWAPSRADVETPSGGSFWC